MDKTPSLQLSLIANKQGQRSTYHDNALKALDTLVMLSVLDRDLSSPPGSPSDGDRYIVKAPGSGDPAWADDNVVVYMEGHWTPHVPQLGWTCYAQDEGALLAWSGSAWEPALDVLGAGAALQNLGLFGLGTTADATNPFSATLNNALWTAKTVAGGGDGNLRYKLSKESSAKTLSFLFQDNFSGRAEIGLTGDDDLHVKVSADGSSWLSALVIDRTTGKLSFGQGFSDPVATRTAACAAPFDALAFNGMQVNGGIEVSQELGTTGATLVNNTAKYVADMAEAMYNHGAATAVVTSGQIAAASFGAVLPGFPNGHRIKATTAITSPANGDFAKHRFKIEGYRVAKLGWGAAGALDIVYAFQFYSTGSGVALLRFSNSAGDRFHHHELTVAAGWNFFAGTVAGDTSGTWLKTTGIGLTVEVFASGKETTPGSTLDSWTATGKIQTTNSGNLLGTNNNETVLTGLFIAPGTQVPVAADLPKLMRPFDVELAFCKRCWEKSYDYGTAVAAATAAGMIGGGINGTANNFYSSVRYQIAKRVNPTATLYSGGGTVNQFSTGPTSTDSNASGTVSSATAKGFILGNTSTASNSVFAHFTADARL